MKYRNILVAYDGSDHAKNAVREALDMAKDSQDCSILTLGVLYDPTFNAASLRALTLNEDGSEDGVRCTEQQHAMEREIAELTKDSSTPVETHMIQSDTPAASIVAFANKHNCDLIVMGCRGMNAVLGMLGSVSNAVLRDATIPVLVVK